MCIICNNDYDTNIISLRICNKISVIPDVFYNLQYLDCYGCKLLTSLPLNSIKLLRIECSGCNIKYIPHTYNLLKHLNCSYCPFIKTIPKEFINLTFLACNSCTLLVNIPHTLINLHQLYLNDCVFITKLSKSFINLCRLSCSNCPYIIYIPDDYIRLTRLWCFNCTYLLSYPNNKYLFINDDNCNWLDKSNIRKIIILQRLFKLKKIKLNIHANIIKYILFNYYII